MIELISFLGFKIIQSYLYLHADLYTYTTTLDFVFFLIFNFSLFAGFFFKIINDNGFKTTTRYLIAIICYVLLVLEACISILYANGSLSRTTTFWIGLKWFSIIFIYVLSFLLFTFRKKIEFRLIKNLGITYLIFLIIDIVCVVSLTYLNIIISPRTILTQPTLISITTYLLFLRAFLCIVVKKFENYWLYKQSLLKKLNQEIVLDKQLPKLSKRIKKGSFLQELKDILQFIHLKKLFIFLISYQVYMICLKYKDKKTCRNYKTSLIQFSYRYLLE